MKMSITGTTGYVGDRVISSPDVISHAPTSPEPLRGFILAIIVFALASCVDLSKDPYWDKVDAGGAIEKKYLKLGALEVTSLEAVAEGSLGRYVAWYPVNLHGSNKRYPIVISNNGTGVGASKYSQWFRHLASWGFIVVGNEEGTSWDGKSAEETLNWLLQQDENPASPLYHHVDKAHIGTIGHSQGGTGAVNCATAQPHSNLFRTVVMLASTHDGYNIFLGWRSDASSLRVPTLVMVGENDGLTNPADLKNLYENIPSSIFKVQARRKGVGHGEMLYIADGYVTAWMLWQLKGDKNAAKAFYGKTPELKANKNFMDVRISDD